MSRCTPKPCGRYARRCDALINPTLGASTIVDPRERVAHIPLLGADPATRPDFAPVDLGSFNIDPYDPVAKSFRNETLVLRHRHCRAAPRDRRHSPKRRAGAVGVVERGVGAPPRRLRRDGRVANAGVRARRAGRLVPRRRIRRPCVASRRWSSSCLVTSICTGPTAPSGAQRPRVGARGGRRGRPRRASGSVTIPISSSARRPTQRSVAEVVRTHPHDRT